MEKEVGVLRRERVFLERVRFKFGNFILVFDVNRVNIVFVVFFFWV